MTIRTMASSMDWRWIAASTSADDHIEEEDFVVAAQQAMPEWRLILAPPAVRRYVVAHEVAHLAHLDHSAKFKVLEARLYGPGVSEAKAQLRRLGPRLKRIGRRR